MYALDRTDAMRNKKQRPHPLTKKKMKKKKNVDGTDLPLKITPVINIQNRLK